VELARTVARFIGTVLCSLPRGTRIARITPLSLHVLRRTPERGSSHGPIGPVRRAYYRRVIIRPVDVLGFLYTTAPVRLYPENIRNAQPGNFTYTHMGHRTI
jgi:hypothetical protein